MTNTILKKNILSKYSINIFNYKVINNPKKGKLMDNLDKYMIKSDGNKKEDLSLNVDKMLYGKQ